MTTFHDYQQCHASFQSKEATNCSARYDIYEPQQQPAWHDTSKGSEGAWIPYIVAHTP